MSDGTSAGITRLRAGMTIGGSPASPAFATSVAANERYFDDFLMYLMGIVGFAYLAETHNTGTMVPYRPTDTMRLDCKHSPANWVWHPFNAMNAMAKGLRPPQLFFHRHPGDAVPVAAELPLGNLDYMVRAYGRSMIGNYYEAHKALIELAFGQEWRMWPPAWQFGRVVRNAMSHNGRIRIDSASAPSVSWKSLTYGRPDNGRAILHTDLWPGDLFDLLIEMDEQIP